MAVKYFAGNKTQGTKSERLALDTQYFSASGSVNTGLDGLIFNETDTNDIFKWDEVANGWELVTGDQASVGQTFALKRFNDLITIDEVSAPTGNGTADTIRLYANGGKLYLRNDVGTVHDLTVGAGATSLGTLSDVTLGGVTLAAGHILVYDGSSVFVNLPLAGETNDTIAMGADGKLDITVLTRLTDLDMSNANHTIFNNMAGKTLTIGASDTAIVTGQNFTVTGDLTVSGTTTTVNTTTLSVQDPVIFLSSGASGSASVDSGLVIERGDDTNVAFVWDENEDEFGAFATTDVGVVAGNIQTGTYQDMQVGGFKATTGAFSGALSTTSNILVNATDATNITAGADGHLIHVDAVTLNDHTTSASGTAAAFNLVSIEAPTLTVTNASTTTNASTVYISGAPIDGDGDLTITNAYALYVAAGIVKFGGTVEQGATTLASLTVTGATVLNGNMDFGNAATDTITVTGQFDSHLIPIADGTYDLGTSTGPKEWRDLWLTGTANIDAIAATTLTDPSITGTLSMLEDAIIVFEGATDNANETTLTVVDPTADRVVSLPDATDTLVGKATTDTLTNKTLTTPWFVDGGAIHDGTHNSGANQLIIFDSVVSAVNEFTILNAATGNGSSTGTPTLSVTGGDTNIALTLKGKGTGASAVIAGGATGACIEFNTKYTGGNPPLGDESARLYLKEVDANNNALAVRIFKANAYQEVEITSPKAICGECGSTDGAKDPIYDFSRSMMIVELWCGHAYEVPMTGWNMVS